MLALPDENAIAGADLPALPFEATQCIILELMTKVFPVGASRFSDIDVFMHFVDEAVAEIGYTWMDVNNG